MKHRAVVSREYKVMLLPQRFRGDEPALLDRAAHFWSDFSAAIAPIAIGVGGSLSQIENRRGITFLDTADCLLKSADYLLRERRSLTTDARDVTLKFRHPDRYFSQDRSMDTDIAGNPRTKFEEDIKPPFVSLYSFSTRVKTDSPFRSLRHVRTFVPDVAGRVEGFDDARPIVPVRGFTARELVLEGGSIQIGRTPKVDAECALIVWDDAAGEVGRPVVAEFSFRYADEAGEYTGGPARRASETLLALQGLSEWWNPEQRTKTAFVFG